MLVLFRKRIVLLRKSLVLVADHTVLLRKGRILLFQCSLKFLQFRVLRFQGLVLRRGRAERLVKGLLHLPRLYHGVLTAARKERYQIIQLLVRHMSTIVIYLGRRCKHTLELQQFRLRQNRQRSLVHRILEHHFL